MNQPIVWIAGALIVGLAVFKMRRAKKPKGRFARLREGVEGALDDAEMRTAELRKRADKLRGEAKRRMHEEAQNLEARQQELRTRLDELKAEATKLFEREKAATK